MHRLPQRVVRRFRPARPPRVAGPQDYFSFNQPEESSHIISVPAELYTVTVHDVHATVAGANWRYSPLYRAGCTHVVHHIVAYKHNTSHEENRALTEALLPCVELFISAGILLQVLKTSGLET